MVHIHVLFKVDNITIPENTYMQVVLKNVLKISCIVSLFLRASSYMICPYFVVISTYTLFVFICLFYLYLFS